MGWLSQVLSWVGVVLLLVGLVIIVALSGSKEDEDDPRDYGDGGL